MENSVDIKKLRADYEGALKSYPSEKATSARCCDYYEDRHWTKEELETFKRRNQPATHINRLKSKINNMIGMLERKNLAPKALPRPESNIHDADAAAMSDAIKFVVDNTKFKETKLEVAKDLYIEGQACGVELIVDGEDILVNRLRSDRTFVDPYAEKRNYSDARYLGCHSWMDVDTAVARFGDLVHDARDKELEESGYGERDKELGVDNYYHYQEKRVKVVQMWRLESGKWFAYFFIGDTLLKRAESPYVNDKGESIHNFVLTSGIIKKSNARASLLETLIPLQDSMNKASQKFIHLISSKCIIAEKGAVLGKNNKQVLEEVQKAASFIEVAPNKRFEVISDHEQVIHLSGQINWLKAELDNSVVNSALAGTDTRSMSGRAFSHISESGMNEIIEPFTWIGDFNRDVYEKIWYLIKQSWTSEKWLRVTDDEQNSRRFALNRRITKGQLMLERARDSGQQLSADDVEMMFQSDPSMYQEVVSNDVSQIDVDILIEETPDFVTTQAEVLEGMKSIISDLQASPNVSPTEKKELLKMYIQASPLRNKDSILKTLSGESKDQQNALQQQLQQAQEQMQQAGQQMEQMQADSEKQIAELKRQLSDAKQNKELDIQLKFRQLQQRDVELQIELEKAEAQRREQKIDYLSMELNGNPPESPIVNISQDSPQLMEGIDMINRTNAEALDKMAERQSADSEAIISGMLGLREGVQEGFKELAELTKDQAKPRKISISRSPEGFVAEAR